MFNPENFPLPRQQVPDFNIPTVDLTVGPATPEPFLTGVNRLHNYQNYTYLFSLEALTVSEYNSLSSASVITVPPVRNVLVSSAGRRSDVSVRNQYWSEDFYLDDVKISSVVGANFETRGSNSLLIEFKVFEPFGVTLLERLFQTAISLGYKRHTDVILGFRVEFMGYDSSGIGTLVPNASKYFPVKILNMTFSINEKGSEYAITAYVVNHSAFSEFNARVPTNISVVGSTVADYFTSFSDLYGDANDFRLAEGQTSVYENARSLSDALNKQEDQKVKEGVQEIPDRYQIIFDNEIANSKIFLNPKQVPRSQTPLNTPAPSNSVVFVPGARQRPPQVVATSRPINEIFIFGANTGSRSNYEKLDAELRRRVEAMATEWYNNTAEKLNVTSAFRTPEDQARLRNLRNQGKNPYEVAKGTSKHELGLAIDISSHQTSRLQAGGYLKRHGLHIPFPNDPVHIEMIPTPVPTTPAPGPGATVPSPAPVETTRDTNYMATTHEITAGTTIIDEINRVIRNSSYLLNDQFPDDPDAGTKPPQQLARELAEKLDKPLNWWKILPKVEFLGFDRKRGTLAKKITYYVKPYKIYSSLLPMTPSTNPEKIQREYNYIYTGKNLDILDFKIDFNMQYFLLMTVPTNMTMSSNSVQKEVETSMYYAETPLPENEIQVPPRQPISGSMPARAATENSRYPKQLLASDLQEYLMGTTSSDMIALDMEIIGDPDFIKQDDVFTNSLDINAPDYNGSFDMDSQEVYVLVNFKTPADYDESTGLVSSQSESTSTRTSLFSGLYRVLTVDSIFREGKFTQKLSLVRSFPEAVKIRSPE